MAADDETNAAGLRTVARMQTEAKRVFILEQGWEGSVERPRFVAVFSWGKVGGQNRCR